MKYHPHWWLLAACIGRFGDGITKGTASPLAGVFTIHSEANDKASRVSCAWHALEQARDPVGMLRHLIEETVLRVS